MLCPARMSIVLCFSATLVGCSHVSAESGGGPAIPAVEYPSPPEAPRARLVRMVPDAAMGPARGRTWRRVLDFLVGTSSVDRTSLLQRPFGVVAEGADRIVVADPDAQRVLRMDLSANRWAEISCPDREWGAPMAAALGRDGTLFVADGGAAEIVAVSREGACRSFGTSSLVRPTGVAYLAGRLYVADPPRHAIVVFSESGERVASYGTIGSGDGQFNFPTSVAISEGSLLVVDALNFRVARLSSTGEWLGAFGSPGESRGELSRPKGVAVDGSGTIFVSDAQRDTVLVYSRSGEYLYSIGAGGDAAGQLSMPAGVSVAGAVLYVADSHHQRVQAFAVLGEGR